MADAADIQRLFGDLAREDIVVVHRPRRGHRTGRIRQRTDDGRYHLARKARRNHTHLVAVDIKSSGMITADTDVFGAGESLKDHIQPGGALSGKPQGTAWTVAPASRSPAPITFASQSRTFSARRSSRASVAATMAASCPRYTAAADQRTLSDTAADKLLANLAERLAKNAAKALKSGENK
ncbi:MAG TPA: hypothetical protein VNJ10_05570 [Sphingomonas sp.]|nr:hypothetical protein [Sphingomonas sp.]